MYFLPALRLSRESVRKQYFMKQNPAECILIPMHSAGFLFYLLTAKQMIPQHQTANNKNQGRDRFWNKQKKRHSNSKTKQHKSNDPLHRYLRSNPYAVSICSHPFYYPQFLHFHYGNSILQSLSPIPYEKHPPQPSPLQPSWLPEKSPFSSLR